MKAAKSLAICTACAVLSLLVSSCVELPPDERVAPAWFPLSEQFTASGFMGEAAYPKALKLRMGQCPKRAPNALGQCFAFVWKRPPKDEIYEEKVVPNGGQEFLGVYWQSPPGNWGEKPPKYVEGGATKLHFKVRGSIKGKINIILGGVGGPRPNGLPPTPYKDDWKREVTDLEFNDTEWTEHNVLIAALDPDDGKLKSPFRGEHKDGRTILGPFAWSYSFTAEANRDNPEDFAIYFDDIVWGWEE